MGFVCVMCRMRALEVGTPRVSAAKVKTTRADIFPLKLDVRRTRWWRKWQRDLAMFVPSVVQRALDG